MTDPYGDPHERGVYDMAGDEINGGRIVCDHGFPLDVRDHRECEPWGTVDQWTARALGEEAME